MSSSAKEYDYHVYLCRGLPSRGKIKARILNSVVAALKRNGIRTFTDDAPLHPAVRDGTIERSRIAIPVLEEDFVSSEHCLDGLEKILRRPDDGKRGPDAGPDDGNRGPDDGKRGGPDDEKRVVQPIFYDVDPTEVRYQTGSFAKAFDKHDKKYKDHPEKVQRWRDALREVANISGFHYSKGRYESDFIDEIVQDVRAKLQQNYKFPFPSFSSCLSRQKNESEVFLSFRGEDTRYKFVDHLRAGLVREGISAFRDDKNLETGKHIASQLEKAIERSQICVVVLSPNYASSTWCLDELLKILHCRKLSNFCNQENWNSAGIYGTLLQLMFNFSLSF